MTMHSAIPQIIPGTTPIFKPEQLLGLNRNRIPFHIAFIPDGNRRWAKQQGITCEDGHRAGGNNFINIIKAAKEIGIKAVTLYTFSTENWTRDEDEIRIFFWLIESFLIEQRQEMIDNGVRLHTIGDPAPLSDSVKKAIQDTKDATAHCKAIDMVMAINYGGRDDIRRAVKSMCQDFANKKLKPEDISEKMIAKYLDTAPWKDPDLLIRTSGEMRISNFLIWQTSYSEVYLSPVYWPDFTPNHLLEAILNFQKRERRWGA